MDVKSRFVDVTERIIYLRSIPVASMLPPPVLKILASNFRERRFAAGEVLMREGEPIHALHLITGGSVSLVRKGKAFGSLAPPQSLGFLGILARGDGNYDATAEVETRSLELDAETMMELLEDHFEFLRATLRYLTERMVAEVKELPAEVLSTRLDGADAQLPENRPLDLVEKLAYFRTLSAFTQTNLNALAVMALTVRESRLEPGTRIWHAGDDAAENLFVLAGKARCWTPDGAKVWRAGPTSAIGGIESMAEQQRWYHLEADTKLCILHLPVSSFIDLLEDDFPMATQFMKRISSDVIGLMEKRAERGLSPTSAVLNVTKLGAVPVGA